MVIIKRIILLSPFVIPTGLFVDTCSKVHIASRGKTAAGHGSAEPCTSCLPSRGELLLLPPKLFGVGFFYLAPDPWAGVGGIRCAAGIRQRGEDQKKEEEPSTKLWDPYREIFFSIPVSPTKSKGSQDLLAQDLGLKVNAELFKPSSLLWEGKY